MKTRTLLLPFASSSPHRAVAMASAIGLASASGLPEAINLSASFSGKSLVRIPISAPMVEENASLVRTALLMH